MKRKNIVSAASRRPGRANILKGTVILTLAGFITRVIGFFYKIFLSKTIGPEWLGIYQLVFPVYGICFTVYATGIQTSISRLVAAEMGRRNPKNAYRILKVGTFLSVVIALLLSLLLYRFSDLVAYRFLLEPRSATSLRILALVFPFCGVTSCINGFYYGLKKAAVPASTQLLEQMIRVVVVYMVALYAGGGILKVTCEIAVAGLVIGEICSSLYNLISIFISKAPASLLLQGPDPNAQPYGRRKAAKNILSFAVPLSANRLLINILHSLEAVLIPAMLKRYGLNTTEALSTFGILTGMSMPFIMFPTSLINALAVLLLPMVSEAQAVSNDKLIGKTTAVSIKYSLIIGIMSTGIFIIFGMDLGNAIFHNEAAGAYLRILAWICPLIYLTTTLGSIINGLGKAHITFINSVSGSLSKILLIVILIPKFGINGYLTALLIGQLIITSLDALFVIRYIHFPFNAEDSILKPGLIVALAGFLLKQVLVYTQKITQINQAILILSFCLLFCVICVALFIITRTISHKDFR